MRRLGSWMAAFLIFGLFAVAGAPSALVAQTDTPNRIVDYETLFASLEPDGSLRTVRLVNQLRVFGQGDIVVTDPAPTDGFRNLSGTGDPQVGEGVIEWPIRGLSGSQEFVTASTPDVEPPLSMVIAYYLNGESIDGPDLVGRSGTIDVAFDVSNVTAEPIEVTYQDGDGNERTAIEQVPIPMVAELQLGLDKGRFSVVEAPGADIITDPNGNLVVRWSMVMVPPIGELTQSFQLRLDTEDFELGAVRLTGVPVAPQDRPFLAFAEEELAHGYESAASLFAGSGELSANLTSLHDGTLDLLDGMEQLFEGSKELASGLQEAFSGSSQITEGGGEATAGAGKLTAGLGDAHDGSGQITGGLGSLGSGLKQILGGLKTLAKELPAAGEGANAIKDGADGIIAIATALAGPGALPDIKAGILNIKAGADGIKAGADAAKPATDGIVAASGPMGTALSGAAAACSGDPACAGSAAGPTIIGAATAGADCLSGSGAGCGLPASIAGLATSASGAFAGISAGAATISGGATALALGIDGVIACLTGGASACSGNPSITVIAGLISAGAVQLAEGVADVLAGLGSPGEAGTLIGGTGEALGGVNQLHAGSARLTSGLSEAVAGSGELTAGLSRLTDGSGQLTAGLGEAADGSGRLSEGLGDAKDGSGQIEQGVYLINEVGVKEVSAAANETAAELDRTLQFMHAQDERAANESLLYGPPSSDQAEVVVGGSGVVLTMDALDNRSSDSATRGIGAVIALVVLGGLLLALRGLRRTPATAAA